MSELKLDEKTLEALQGLTPMNNTSTIAYTPKEFAIKDDDGNELIPIDKRPVFHLRSYSTSENQKVKRMMKNIKNTSDTEVNALGRLVVTDITNLLDSASGDLIEYSGDEKGCDNELWNTIPEGVRASILRKAMSISGLIYLEASSL